MTDVLRSECELCREVDLAGTAVTGADTRIEPDDRFSRLILRTDVLDVLSGLGSLVPGYVLVIPRRHVLSTGELSVADMRHVLDITERMGQHIADAFGKSVVAVEHGSSGFPDSAAMRPACITHAHIHLFPIPDGEDPHRFVIPGSRPVPDLLALRELSAKDRNYYFCAWPSQNYVTTRADMGSQYARRIWAQTTDRPDEWDWAAFPHIDHCRETTVTLRKHPGMFVRPASEQRVRETLAAYTANAQSYAHNTQRYSEGSTLRREVEEFHHLTSGTLLDAGAGGCRDALRFAELGRRVIAADAVAPLLRAAPRHPGVTPLVADVRSLPLRGASVGAVWCSAVLLHLDALGVMDALRQFHRVLKPGGLVQISVKEGRGSVALPFSPEYRRHFYFYRFGQLRDLATSVGFDVKHTWVETQADSSGTPQAWRKLLLQQSR